MKPLAILLTLLSAAGVILALFKFTENARANVQGPIALAVSEMNLNPDGNAYEVSLDGSGDLWISDYTAGELWQVDPARGVYTTFPVSGTPGDAQPDENGKIWWVDTENFQIRRLSPDLNLMDQWDIPGSSKLYGLRVETPEKIWATDASLPYLYGLNLTSSQVCTYTIPDEGSSGYLVLDNGQIWSGDWINERIYRLDPGLNQYTFWQLPAGSVPEGLAFGPSGNIWWSSFNQGILDRLDPGTGQLSRYNIPEGTLPEMIAWINGSLWYGEDSLGTIGLLDPLEASFTPITLTKQILPVTPQCGGIQASKPVAITPITGTATFNPNTYPVLVDALGWTIYQLPDKASPWGIIHRERDAWLVDSNRQVLVKIPINAEVTACKVEDRDGDPLTTNDQSPLEGWPLYLNLAGVRQTPAQPTDADGCTTWSNLNTGVSYGVEEDILPGWEPLTPITHSFGVAEISDHFTHTFINKNMSTITITTCTLTDADGNPNTTGDQTPLPDQTVYLHMDGVRQEPGLVTGADGCQLWSDLAPDHTYGVEQAGSPNYVLLGEAIHDFGVLSPGAVVSHNFINARGVTVQACSLADADGDPLTTGDQVPLPGQTIYLLVDGDRQEPGFVTGADGCQVWSDLAPNHTYGVEQVLSPGWEALTLSSYTFDLALPGSTFQGTFVNRRTNLKLFVPLVFH
jgi:streptogramin lyase